MMTMTKIPPMYAVTRTAGVSFSADSVFDLSAFPGASLRILQPLQSSAGMGLCSNDTCTRRPAFNFQGSKKAAYCRQHAEDGMVDVQRRRCSHGRCTKYPTFNVEGSKAAVCCRHHAEDGMVDVHHKRCSHNSCTKNPHFNVEGSITAAYCKQHAGDGMVNVRTKLCSHTPCARRPVWGLATDCTPAVCSHHRCDIVGGPVIHFRRMCKTEGCKKDSRWGPHGQQPTQCHDHGPVEDNLVCIAATSTSKGSCASPPCDAVPGPSFHIKTD